MATRHEVRLKPPKKGILISSADFVFHVKKDRKMLGKIRISQGGLVVQGRKKKAKGKNVAGRKTIPWRDIF